MHRYIYILILLLFGEVVSAQCNITFNSQLEVDNFLIDYPNCTIVGDVTIQGDDITDLSAISGLQEVGDLVIDSCINLTTIDLPLITTARWIFIYKCHNLKLINFPLLHRIDSDLWIDGNEVLDRIIMPSLDSIRDDFILQKNTNIQSDSIIFGQIRTLNRLTVEENHMLENLIFMRPLTRIGWACEIQVNDNLISLTGLDSLKYIAGFLDIRRNTSLLTLEGLETLEQIGNSLSIGSNLSLTSTLGLRNLEIVGTPTSSTTFIDFSILASLSSLDGLENLKEVHGDFYISTSVELQNLDQLNNLSIVKGNIVLKENFGLTDISGLDNIDVEGIDSISISSNSELKICHSSLVCDLIELNKPMSIEDNDIGCKSREEVSPNCLTSSLDLETANDKLSSYPNPTEGKIYLDHQRSFHFSIYSLEGNYISEGTNTHEGIDLSDLPSGVYIVHYQFGSQFFTNRVIKL